MADYIFLIHALPPGEGTQPPAEAWDTYFGRLIQAGVMRGGSAIGRGACFRKSGDAPAITAHLDGYIKIEAVDMDDARQWLSGHPVFEAGGVVEIRELPRDS